MQTADEYVVADGYRAAVNAGEVEICVGIHTYSRETAVVKLHGSL